MNVVEDAEELVRLAQETYIAAKKDIDASYSGMIAKGNHRLNDVEFLAWIAMLEEQFPREDWVTPQGHAVNASPLLLAMSLTANGKEDLARYQRLVEGR